MASNGFNTSFGANNQYALNGNSHSSDKKSSPEYKKIFCAFHPAQFLTNFCIDRQCLMPLCPTCVVEHTEQHYQCNQKPTYVNMNDALQDSKQRCYANIIKLEEFNRKNVELSNYIQGLPDYIRKQLAQCKQRLYQFIDQRFEAFQNRLIEEIRDKYAEDGVYNRKQCQEVRQYISAEIDSLYDKINQLKGDQCLSALIRYYQSDEALLQSSIGQIVNYIDKNKQAGGIYIALNNEELKRGFDEMCERIVNLEYIRQDQPKSLNSSKNIEGGSNKKMVTSIVNKVNQGNKSNVKDKGANKSYSQSQAFSSRRQEKNSYPSPFKNTDI